MENKENLKASKFLKYKALSGSAYAIAGRGFCRSANIVIPSASSGGTPVTAIYKNAFKDDGSIESIVIPEGVTTIGAWAFSGCYSLKKVSLPSTLACIGEGAFYGCTSLEEIDISVLKNIPYASFGYCISLKSIDLTHIESIGDEAFGNCTSLAEIKMPNIPFFFPMSAFKYCKFWSLENAWSGDLLNVGGYVFGCRKGAEFYTLDANVKCIMEDAFDSGKRYIRQKNLKYETEIKEYNIQMEYFDVALQCPNVPLIYPGDEPKEYTDIPVPIQIHYEGTLAEWEKILCFKSRNSYPVEITAADGTKKVLL